MWLSIKDYARLVRVDIREVLLNFKPTLSFFLPQISISIYNTLDRIILGSLGNTFDVGIYTQAVNLNSILISLVATLSAVLLPRMTNLHAQGKRAEVSRVMKTSMLFNCILTFPVVVGVLLVSQEFVQIFLGKGYAETYVAINIVVSSLIPIAFSEIVGRQTLIPTDNVRYFTISVVTGAVVSILLNLLAIPLWGYRGAAFTLVIVEIIVCILMSYYARNYLDIVDLLKIATKPLVASVVTGTLVYLLFSSVLSISNNLLSMLLKVIVYSIVYGFLLLLTKTISHKELSLLRKKR
jgi:flippase wzx